MKKLIAKIFITCLFIVSGINLTGCGNSNNTSEDMEIDDNDGSELPSEPRGDSTVYVPPADTVSYDGGNDTLPK